MSDNTQTTEITVIPPSKPLRDERGRLLPGQTANLSGRPKTKHITEAFKYHLGKEKGPFSADKIAKRALSIAAKGKDPVAIGAIQFITEHTEGKATQRIELEQSLDSDTIQRLTAIAEALQGSRNQV